MKLNKNDGVIGNVHGQDFPDDLKRAQNFIVLISLIVSALGASVVFYSIFIK